MKPACVGRNQAAQQQHAQPGYRLQLQLQIFSISGMAPIKR